MQLLKNNAKEYIILGIIYTVIIVPLIYFGIAKDMWIILFPAIIAIPLLYMVFKKPEIWLYTSMGMFVLFTRSREAGVNPLDYFFAFYYIGGIILWLLWQVLVKREKLVRNYGDMFILFFSLCILGNFFVGYFADVKSINWAREASFLFLNLFYFPIRHYFNTEKKIKPFMIFFAAVLVIVSITHIYTYYYALSDMEYAYQLATADKINQMIFSVGIIFGLTFTFYQRKRINELFLIIFIGMVTVALILTFSRTFWLIDIIMMAVLFLYLPIKKRISMFKIAAILIVFAVLGFVFLLGDKTELISSMVEKRLTSTSAGAKDESLQARFVEWNYALGEIGKYPLSGKGMASEVHFFNILTGTTFHTTTIHNGYIFLCFRLGIPMALLYLAFLMFYTIKALFLSIRKSNIFFKAMSISCFLGFLSVWLANFTSAQFVYRDGYFTILLLVAFTSIADYNINLEKNDVKLIEAHTDLPTETELI